MPEKERRFPNKTRAEKSAYSRGYQAALQGRWPVGKATPNPPEPVIRRLMDAVVNIRAEADVWQATLPPDDELTVAMNALMDEADAGLDAVADWLTTTALERALRPGPETATGEGRAPARSEA